jgi:membrane-associated phospholipid phosphatase
MNLKNVLTFPLIVLLIICSYFVLDARIALAVRRAWMSSAHAAVYSATIPDFLFPVVCSITGIAWIAYFYLAHKGIHDVHARFFRLVAVTVPLTFFLESILKHVVGRTNTRYWLHHPTIKEFRWLHGVGHYNGFPSGHMAVFTALVIALYRFYPRYRSVFIGFLSVLALALIATDYHFLSDIIGGAYLGWMVHFYTLKGLTLLRNGNGTERDNL